MSQPNALPKILYVDDDSDDCILLTESFASASADLVCASDGQTAIKYLHSVETGALPSLIILDLNMPGWDGKQTLNYIKSDPSLSSIPVVILSTSENRMDKEVCSRLGAASYFQKPFHYDGYKEVVKSCMPLVKI
ncbi:MAG TPA: response regulator [Flavisolibacter sp.]|nr:response regulator [Flavisolibacter sp.]